MDWDPAVSVIAHDLQVKDLYVDLMRAADRPDLFIDIGGNYGTHSLLFLVHGFDTLTFEPNTRCRPYFEEICALNGVSPRLENVALSDHVGTAQLHFSERDTWDGSIKSPSIAGSQDVVAERVEVRTLDSYMDKFRSYKNVLVKIDAEGAEMEVFTGARSLIESFHPTIIFEVKDDAWDRDQLFQIFDDAGYSIAALPCRLDGSTREATLTDFGTSIADNFVAFHTK